MGLFKTLRGVDLTPDQEDAVRSLKATLPDGWEFKELRRQLVGRRPVKHETFGAVVSGPGRTVAAIALDGVRAVQALASVVPGSASAARQWAPPAIQPSSPELREPWPAMTDSPEEEQARAAVLDLLPDSAVLSTADKERFGPLRIFAVTAHLPDQTGIAGFGLDPASAYAALAARLRGQLPVTDVWVLEV